LKKVNRFSLTLLRRARGRKRGLTGPTIAQFNWLGGMIKKLCGVYKFERLGPGASNSVARLGKS